jgi:hypothetical protein
VTGVVWRDERTDESIRDELDRRHPERRQLRPTDVEGLGAAFTVLADLWAPTIARARQLPRPKVHERVNGEYSFVETFRHLLFAWEAWLSDTVLPARAAWHEWGIPPDDGFASEAPTPVLWSPGTGWATGDEAPSLDAVLDVRAQHFARVRDYLSNATSEDVAFPGSPPPWHQEECSVLYCLRVVLHDEWWHHQFATRDLAVLEQL